MHHRHRAMGLEQQRRHGFADDIGAADHHRMLAGKVATAVLQQAHASGRGAGRGYFAALDKATAVLGMETIDILQRVDGLEHAVLVDMVGQRQLNQDAVDCRVGVKPLDQLKQGGFARVGRQLVLDRANSGFLGAQHLVAYINLAGRVAAYQHHSQPWLNADAHKLFDLDADFTQNPRGGGLAVDDFHAGEAVHRKITVRSWLRKTRCSRWYFTALDRATVSVSRPMATRSSGRWA